MSGVAISRLEHIGRQRATRRVSRPLVALFFGIRFALDALLPGAAFATPPAGRPITVEDVLAMERLDRVKVSPDGITVAAVVLRGALPREVYGRTSYEVDPSRGDVWLIDRQTGAQRNLTEGRALAAGAWCPMWSPDGQRLAFMSTRPEGSEPRGGDNVRLYIWGRGEKQPRRLGNWAIATQTRYGGAIRKLDIAGPGSTSADPCRQGEDNPPFVWLDERRLLVAALARGKTSGLLDETDRLFRHTAETRALLRDGHSAVVSAAGSGSERTTMDADENVMLTVVNAADGARTDITELPAYPFNGSLALRVSPDGRRAAIMATVGALDPRDGVPWSRNDGDWLVQKQLGIVDLLGSSPVRWIKTPEAAPLPLALMGWSSDGRQIGFTARTRPQDTTFALFALDTKLGSGLIARTGRLRRERRRTGRRLGTCRSVLRRASSL